MRQKSYGNIENKAKWQKPFLISRYFKRRRLNSRMDLKHDPTIIYFYKRFSLETHNLDESPEDYVNEKSQAQRLHIISFICITFLKQQNCRNGEQINDCQRLCGWIYKGSGWSYKWTPWGIFFSDETVLFRDCINANILVLILHYSFARC